MMGLSGDASVASTLCWPPFLTASADNGTHRVLVHLEGAAPLLCAASGVQPAEICDAAMLVVMRGDQPLSAEPVASLVSSGSDPCALRWGAVPDSG